MSLKSKINGTIKDISLYANVPDIGRRAVATVYTRINGEVKAVYSAAEVVTVTLNNKTDKQLTVTWNSYQDTIQPEKSYELKITADKDHIANFTLEGLPENIIYGSGQNKETYNHTTVINNTLTFNVSSNRTIDIYEAKQFTLTNNSLENVSVSTTSGSPYNVTFSCRANSATNMWFVKNTHITVAEGSFVYNNNSYGHGNEYDKQVLNITLASSNEYVLNPAYRISVINNSNIALSIVYSSSNSKQLASARSYVVCHKKDINIYSDNSDKFMYNNNVYTSLNLSIENGQTITLNAHNIVSVDNDTIYYVTFETYEGSVLTLNPDSEKTFDTSQQYINITKVSDSANNAGEFVYNGIIYTNKDLPLKIRSSELYQVTFEPVYNALLVNNSDTSMYVQYNDKEENIIPEGTLVKSIYPSIYVRAENSNKFGIDNDNNIYDGSITLNIDKTKTKQVIFCTAFKLSVDNNTSDNTLTYIARDISGDISSLEGFVDIYVPAWNNIVELYCWGKAIDTLGAVYKQDEPNSDYVNYVTVNNDMELAVYDAIDVTINNTSNQNATVSVHNPVIIPNITLTEGKTTITVAKNSSISISNGHFLCNGIEYYGTDSYQTQVTSNTTITLYPAYVLYVTNNSTSSLIFHDGLNANRTVEANARDQRIVLSKLDIKMRSDAVFKIESKAYAANTSHDLSFRENQYITVDKAYSIIVKTYAASDLTFRCGANEQIVKSGNGASVEVVLPQLTNVNISSDKEFVWNGNITKNIDVNVTNDYIYTVYSAYELVCSNNSGYAIQINDETVGSGENNKFLYFINPEVEVTCEQHSFTIDNVAYAEGTKLSINLATTKSIDVEPAYDITVVNNVNAVTYVVCNSLATNITANSSKTVPCTKTDIVLYSEDRFMFNNRLYAANEEMNLTITDGYSVTFEAVQDILITNNTNYPITVTYKEGNKSIPSKSYDTVTSASSNITIKSDYAFKYNNQIVSELTLSGITSIQVDAVYYVYVTNNSGHGVYIGTNYIQNGTKNKLLYNDTDELQITSNGYPFSINSNAYPINYTHNMSIRDGGTITIEPAYTYYVTNNLDALIQISCGADSYDIAMNTNTTITCVDKSVIVQCYVDYALNDMIYTNNNVQHINNLSDGQQLTFNTVARALICNRTGGVLTLTYPDGVGTPTTINRNTEDVTIITSSVNNIKITSTQDMIYNGTLYAVGGETLVVTTKQLNETSGEIVEPYRGIVRNKSSNNIHVLWNEGSTYLSQYQTTNIVSAKDIATLEYTNGFAITDDEEVYTKYVFNLSQTNSAQAPELVIQDIVNITANNNSSAAIDLKYYSYTYSAASNSRINFQVVKQYADQIYVKTTAKCRINGVVIEPDGVYHQVSMNGGTTITCSDVYEYIVYNNTGSKLFVTDGITNKKEYTDKEFIFISADNYIEITSDRDFRYNNSIYVAQQIARVENHSSNNIMNVVIDAQIYELTITNETSSSIVISYPDAVVNPSIIGARDQGVPVTSTSSILNITSDNAFVYEGKVYVNETLTCSVDELSGKTIREAYTGQFINNTGSNVVVNYIDNNTSKSKSVTPEGTTIYTSEKQVTIISSEKFVCNNSFDIYTRYSVQLSVNSRDYNIVAPYAITVNNNTDGDIYFLCNNSSISQVASDALNHKFYVSPAYIDTLKAACSVLAIDNNGIVYSGGGDNYNDTQLTSSETLNFNNYYEYQFENNTNNPIIIVDNFTQNEYPQGENVTYQTTSKVISIVLNNEGFVIEGKEYSSGSEVQVSADSKTHITHVIIDKIPEYYIRFVNNTSGDVYVTWDGGTPGELIGNGIEYPPEGPVKIKDTNIHVYSDYSYGIYGTSVGADGESETDFDLKELFTPLSTDKNSPTYVVFM